MESSWPAALTLQSGLTRVWDLADPAAVRGPSAVAVYDGCSFLSSLQAERFNMKTLRFSGLCVEC